MLCMNIFIFKLTHNLCSVPKQSEKQLQLIIALESED